jgi:5-methylthioadenosine/S-adenosylhomocysteine deaminase
VSNAALPLTFAAALVLAQGAPPADLLVRAGTIVTIDPDMRVLEGGSVVVRGNTIDAVLGADADLPAARETIDARGHLVIPGLVNAHGHVPMVLLRGVADDLALMAFLNDFIFPIEAREVDREFVRAGTLLACLEMARSGTTTFADMYYFEEEIARAVDEAGLRAVLGQTIIGFPAPDHETPQAALAAAEVFVEQFSRHPRIVPSLAPHALYTTPLEVIERAHHTARRLGVPLQMHAAESPEEDREVTRQFGRSTIAVLDGAGVLGPGTLLHHVITPTEADIATLARRGASTSHNPESNLKTAAGIAPVSELLAAGVAVGLGTDGAASNNSLDMFEEMDTAAKIHKLRRNDPTAMPAKTVLQMATIGGARALGLGDRIGSIEAGKRADLALVALDSPELTPLYDVYSHLVYAAKGANVRTVVVDGRIVLRDRRILTLDEPAVLEQARRVQRRILAGMKERERRP